MSNLTIIFNASHTPTLLSASAPCPRWEARMLPGTTPHGRRYKSRPPRLGKHQHTRIYHASLQTNNGPGGGCNAAPIEVALKWVTGRDNITALKWEAGFYEGSLRPLQGVVVPRFYGLFEATFDGVAVGCLALEWCGGAARTHPVELERQRWLAASRLHDAGVSHGCLQDGRHFVVARDRTLRIVDFSEATIHACHAQWCAPPGEKRPSQCLELDMLERAFMRRPRAYGQWFRRMTTLFRGCRKIDPDESFFVD